MAASTTMITTLQTVNVVLLMNARSTTESLTWSTATMFSSSTQSLGRVNARSAASPAVLLAVSRMKAKGTRKTTIETRMAMVPMVQARRLSLFIAWPPFGW
jgi:hypothetical protein